MTSVGPFTPIEYAQWYLSSSRTTILSTNVILDNTNSIWDTTGKHGNTTLTKSDASSNTITFMHSGYVGPKITGTSVSVSSIHPDQISAMGISTASVSDFELIVVGVALLVAATIIDYLSGGAATVVIYGLVISGAGLIIAGATSAFFTPQLVSTTCNPNSTSCCNDFTSSVGAFTTCIACESNTAACTSVTSTPTGGLGSFLGDIEYIIIIGAVVVVIVLVLYFVLKWRSSSPKSSGSFVAVPAGAYG